MALDICSRHAFQKKAERRHQRTCCSSPFIKVSPSSCMFKLKAHRNTFAVKILFGFPDGDFTEVENGCCQGGIGTAFLKSSPQMFQTACAAACDDGHLNSIGNESCKSDVIAGFYTVLLHGCQENFAGTPGFCFLRPGDRIQGCRTSAIPAAMAFYNIATARCLVFLYCIYCHNQTA